MSFICNICNDLFITKGNLNRHWVNKRCKASFINNLAEMSEFIGGFIDKNNNLTNENNTLRMNIHNIINNNDIITLSKNDDNNITLSKNDDNKINITNNNNITNNITNNVNIKIEINPISKLNTKYIDTDKLKNLIYKYDDMTEKTPEKLNILLSGYLKGIICDINHPENHAVKYTKIKPPTYRCLIEDSDGNQINVIKNLKDTCELLTNPMVETLKKKMRIFLKKYSKDDKDDFDYGLYDTAIDKLKLEINNENIKKSLKNVLQNDILNDIQMKFKITRN